MVVARRDLIDATVGGGRYEAVEKRGGGGGFEDGVPLVEQAVL